MNSTQIQNNLNIADAINAILAAMPVDQRPKLMSNGRPIQSLILSANGYLESIDSDGTAAPFGMESARLLLLSFNKHELHPEIS
jgi:hypothetical protein